jgi:hypothetical protein
LEQFFIIYLNRFISANTYHLVQDKLVINSRLELISLSEIEMYQNKCDELEKEIDELLKKQEKV